MNVLKRAFLSIIRGLKWKLRYGGKISCDFPVAMEKVMVEKDPHGWISIGKKTQNRGNLYLICKKKGRIEIGEHCFFNTNSSLTALEGIKIGNYCKFGNNLVIVDHDHSIRNEEIEFLASPITIGDHVWIGANCTILKGVQIGDGSVVSAGSVVRKSIPPGSVYYEKKDTIIVKK